MSRYTRRLRLPRPSCRYSDLSAGDQRVVRAIIREGLRAQRIPTLTGLTENEAIESVITLIEHGYARIEEFIDRDDEAAYRIVPVGGGS